MTLINLNADVGESFGPWRMGADEALIPLIRSANVACGFHAGDPVVMSNAVKLAQQHGVGLGAHPGYPDLQGFGRRVMQLDQATVSAQLIYQMGALQGIAQAHGSRLEHVKPHGALNNQACVDEALARTIAHAIRAFDRDLILLAPACSALARQGEAAGLTVAHELYADRGYADDGQLLGRQLPGAVLHDVRVILQRIIAMLEARALITHSGQRLPTPIHSICVHGDHPEAVASAQQLSLGLQMRGYRLATLREVCQRPSITAGASASQPQLEPSA